MVTIAIEKQKNTIAKQCLAFDILYTKRFALFKKTSQY